MSIKSTLLRFGRDTNGVSTAEFAMVVPVMLLLMLGTIDVGLYAWSINQAEKATQTGARWAVATDMVASGLVDYSFAVDGGIPQGTIVPASAFPGLTCDESSCTCAGSCNFPTTINSAAFTNIVTRMQDIKADIRSSDVTIDYEYSGLGFSGDPNGPDVAPIVTVKLEDQTYQPITLAVIGVTLDLPDYRYSLTSEDSEGSFSN